MRLDTKTIAGLTLPNGKAERFYWDDELKGFGFRLRQRGGRLHRTWIVPIPGQWPHPPPNTGHGRGPARTRSTRCRPQGLGWRGARWRPAAGSGGKRQAQAHTFTATAAAYLEARKSELRPASYRAADLYLTGDYFKPLHPAAVSGITHAEVAAALRTIGRERSAATASAARRAVSTFFGWAIAEGLMGNARSIP